jgi:hypothetical protein
MKISKTHQRFADLLHTQSALRYPEEFLGPNWRDVLNFWFFINTLSFEQLNRVGDIYRNIAETDRISATNLAANAATDTIMSCSIAHEAFIAPPGLAGGTATLELIGSHKILEQGRLLTFVPLFLEL